MNTGERIKKIRELFRMTQTEFGEKLGFKWTKIKDLESGKLHTTAEIALLIEKIYSIDLRWLLTGEGPMLRSDSQDRLVNIPDPHGTLSSALKLLSALPEERQNDCLHYIQDKCLLLDLLRRVEKLENN
ncbi:helix-turn-helix transcriptional regulator [bacterium]|nr:helix-turn-helix transcriptional regulator [bacterium]MBP5435945.1 helix-turn-helix transcriptional regulator [bacterium]